MAPRKRNDIPATANDFSRQWCKKKHQHSESQQNGCNFNALICAGMKTKRPFLTAQIHKSLWKNPSFFEYVAKVLNLNGWQVQLDKSSFSTTHSKNKCHFSSFHSIYLDKCEIQFKELLAYRSNFKRQTATLNLKPHQ